MTESFGSSVPPMQKEFKNQTDIDTITDEEYEALKTPFEFSGWKIAYQILCFLFCLGPLRLVAGIFIFIFSAVIIICIRVLMHTLHAPLKTGQRVCMAVARFGIRSILFVFGIFYIQTEGHFHEDARFAIANHVSIIDAFALLIFHDLRCPINITHRANHPLGLLIECADPIYVDWRHKVQSRKMILDSVDDFAKPPVLIFPEGLTSRACGQVLMRFGRTAFSTPYKVQPITMRYHMWGVPEGWNTYAFRGESWLSFFWRLISMPIGKLSIEFHEVMSIDRLGKGDIETFISASQLLMANYIGIRAIDRKEERVKPSKKSD